MYLVPKQNNLAKEKFLCGNTCLFWGIYFFLGSFRLELMTQLIGALSYYISAWLSFKKQKEARKS